MNNFLTVTISIDGSCHGKSVNLKKKDPIFFSTFFVVGVNSFVYRASSSDEELTLATFNTGMPDIRSQVKQKLQVSAYLAFHLHIQTLKLK